MTEQEIYDGIQVNEAINSCEISHKNFGGSMTIYRPQREHFHSGEGVRINPGYINASSWGICGSHDKSAEQIRLYMLCLLRMWEIAIGCLNKYNEVLPDWQPIENPFREARDYKKHYESARDELKAIADAKYAKKKKVAKSG